MTHFPSKRSSRPGVVLAAVAGLVAALGLGAVGEAHSAPAPAAVAPGAHREEASVPADEPNILPQGTGQDRSGTVIVYDTPVAHGGSTGSATVRITSHDVTARHLALGSDLDEAAHEPNGEQVPAVGTAGGRIVLDGAAFPGDRDTLITDSPGPDVISPARIRASCPKDGVDLLHGRATTAVERSVTRAPGRWSAADDGRGTAVRPLIRDTEARTRTVADHLRGTGNRAPHARR
ncbi:hypothetical protein [Streptomyces sp. NPDC088766]|uniref:hypothetical protein n=1 Tax=Streptomyces sp. NPDC088766 TaxID=3365893 RepID=UPI003805D491